LFVAEKKNKGEHEKWTDLAAFWVYRKRTWTLLSHQKSFKQVKTMADADHHISGPYSSFVTPKSSNDSYLQAVANRGKRFG
jgi:hypothetical protein